MARIAKKTKRYRSDLTDEEWLEITPLMPNAGASGPSARGGVPRGDQRGALSGALGLRVADAAVSLRTLATVYGWFRDLARRFLFQTIHDLALMVDRERAGREASPSAG